MTFVVKSLNEFINISSLILSYDTTATDKLVMSMTRLHLQDVIIYKKWIEKPNSIKNILYNSHFLSSSSPYLLCYFLQLEYLLLFY